MTNQLSWTNLANIHDENLALQIVAATPDSYRFFNEKIKSNIKIAKLAIFECPQLIEVAPVNIANNKSIATIAVEKHGTFFKYIPNILKQDPSLISLAIKRGCPTEFIDFSFLNKNDILALLPYRPEIYEKIDNNQKQDKDIQNILFKQYNLKIKLSSNILERTMKSLQTEDEILSALSSNSDLFSFLKPSQWTTNILLRAVSNYGPNYFLLDKEHQLNHEIAKKAFKYNHLFLAEFPKELKNDETFLLKIVGNSAEIVSKYGSKIIQKKPHFILKAVEENDNYYHHIHPELKKHIHSLSTIKEDLEKYLLHKKLNKIIKPAKIKKETKIKI